MAPPSMPDFSGAVLAGGRSRRMGRDKALIDVGGRPLVTIAADALADAGATEIFVVGGDEPAMSGLGLRFVPDRFPGEGPLGGIITALATARNDRVVVLSCDLTAAVGPAVTSVLGALSDRAAAAVPVVDGVAQWHHAAWHRSALPSLEAAFSAGVRSPRAATVDLEIVQLLDGSPCWYHDADTPTDLDR